LRKRKEDWESVTDNHPEYIRFYTALWLILNDVFPLPNHYTEATLTRQVIIGIALGSYIIDNSGPIAESISEMLRLYSVAALQRTLAWLMDCITIRLFSKEATANSLPGPAGLKLNNELAAFLGDLFLWVIDHWSSK
jgi:phosphatidylinositol glycan class Q protein